MNLLTYVDGHPERPCGRFPGKQIGMSDGNTEKWCAARVMVQCGKSVKRAKTRGLRRTQHVPGKRPFVYDPTIKPIASSTVHQTLHTSRASTAGDRVCFLVLNRSTDVFSRSESIAGHLSLIPRNHPLEGSLIRLIPALTHSNHRT